jgi:hypothetical protein
LRARQLCGLGKTICETRKRPAAAIEQGGPAAAVRALAPPISYPDSSRIRYLVAKLRFGTHFPEALLPDARNGASRRRVPKRSFLIDAKAEFTGEWLTKAKIEPRWDTDSDLRGFLLAIGPLLPMNRARKHLKGHLSRHPKVRQGYGIRMAGLSR